MQSPIPNPFQSGKGTVSRDRDTVTQLMRRSGHPLTPSESRREDRESPIPNTLAPGGLVKRDRDRVTQLGKRTIPLSNSPRSAVREPGRASQSPLPRQAQHRLITPPVRGRTVGSGGDDEETVNVVGCVSSVWRQALVLRQAQDEVT